MKKTIRLNLSETASEKLTKLSQQLGISRDEFATICFEFVDIKSKGIAAAAGKIKERKVKEVFDKKDLSQHLNQLSVVQVELLLNKAAQRKKN